VQSYSTSKSFVRYLYLGSWPEATVC